MLPAFDNSYARLPERFFARLDPVPVSDPELIRINQPLAEQLGIDAKWLASREGIAMLAGNVVPDGASPLAMAYAGHQFGGWVPQLGDGRALLLGELIDRDGQRFDLQWKGSGRTPYSRGGDGRAPLGPVIREYVVSEAMFALGVPTTRSLAAVRSGDDVYREELQPGGVLMRVARSHIRIGTFQFFAARQDIEALRLLCEHVIARHYPDAAGSANPPAALLDAVIAAQASLVARWQALGFIHGVMNTDNMLLSGETIDFGPCAFMDTFHPDTVFSSIDRMGRYAYAQQPAIAHWNLACLAQALLPLLADTSEKQVAIAQQSVDVFPGLFSKEYRTSMLRKLGLQDTREGDDELISSLLDAMAAGQADFTLSFRRLADLATDHSAVTIDRVYELPEAVMNWLPMWRGRLRHDAQSDRQRQQLMYAANPAFIPRNHLVEQAIRAAVDDKDLTPFNRLVERLVDPHRFDPDDHDLAKPPRPEQLVRETFCGT